MQPLCSHSSRVEVSARNLWSCQVSQNPPFQHLLSSSKAVFNTPGVNKISIEIPIPGYNSLRFLSALTKPTFLSPDNLPHFRVNDAIPNQQFSARLPRHFLASARSAFPIATTDLRAISLVSSPNCSLTDIFSILSLQKVHLSLLNPGFPFHNSLSISPQRVLPILLPLTSMT